jgi:hypothetical protein
MPTIDELVREVKEALEADQAPLAGLRAARQRYNAARRDLRAAEKAARPISSETYRRDPCPGSGRGGLRRGAGAGVNFARRPVSYIVYVASKSASRADLAQQLSGAPRGGNLFFG